MDALIICLGGILFIYRSRKIRFKDDWFENSRVSGIYLGYFLVLIGPAFLFYNGRLFQVFNWYKWLLLLIVSIVLFLFLQLKVSDLNKTSWMKTKLFGIVSGWFGLGLAVWFLFRDVHLHSFPIWSQWLMLALALLLTAIVILPLFLLAYMSMNLPPIKFFDRFGMWEEEIHAHLPGAYPSDTVKTIVRTLWVEKQPVNYIRHQAVASVDTKVQQMRMNLGRIVVTTIPALIFSFAIISSVGQSLGFWTILRDSDQSPAGQLVDHTYFVCSVVSTLGLGDMRPRLDSSGLGEIFVIIMVTIFMLSALIVFSLLIGFAHSMLTALEGEISNTINDLSLDSPRMRNSA